MFRSCGTVRSAEW